MSHHWEKNWAWYLLCLLVIINGVVLGNSLFWLFTLMVE